MGSLPARPGTIGTLRLKDRLVMASMATNGRFATGFPARRAAAAPGVADGAGVPSPWRDKTAADAVRARRRAKIVAIGRDVLAATRRPWRAGHDAAELRAANGDPFRQSLASRSTMVDVADAAVGDGDVVSAVEAAWMSSTLVGGAKPPGDFLSVPRDASLAGSGLGLPSESLPT